MQNTTEIVLNIPMNLGGERLDIALQQLLPQHSRSRIQTWIKADLVRMDAKAVSAKTKVWGGETVSINPPENAQENAW